MSLKEKEDLIEKVCLEYEFKIFELLKNSWG